MNVSAAPVSSAIVTSPLALQQQQQGKSLNAADKASPELREKFTDFVGQTFYSQLLSSMRKSVEKPAYFHGGRGEEVFQGQLDQILAEDMTKATADQFTGPMFDLFMLGRAS